MKISGSSGLNENYIFELSISNHNFFFCFELLKNFLPIQNEENYSFFKNDITSGASGASWKVISGWKFGESTFNSKWFFFKFLLIISENIEKQVTKIIFILWPIFILLCLDNLKFSLKGTQIGRWINTQGILEGTKIAQLYMKSEVDWEGGWRKFNIPTTTSPLF